MLQRACVVWHAFRSPNAITVLWKALVCDRVHWPWVFVGTMEQDHRFDSDKGGVNSS